MAEEKQEFMTYKGRPLVRSKKILYADGYRRSNQAYGASRRHSEQRKSYLDFFRTVRLPLLLRIGFRHSRRRHHKRG